MKSIFPILAITIAMASCKKETVTSPVSSKSKKLVQVTYAQSGVPDETEKIFYDDKGRITRHINGKFTYDLTYESDTRIVATSRKTADNTLLSNIECTLNNNGNITELLMKNPAGQLTYTYQFTYDGNGYMYKVKGFAPNDSGYETIAEIVNGDIISTKTYNNGGVLSYTGYFTYEGAKPSKLPNALFSYWPSPTLFGKTRPHLITQYKTIRPAGNMDWHTTHSYQTDADGDVTQQITNYLLTGEVETASYQYQ